MLFDLRRFSIHDGPGIRTTIFLKGCPLDCWWCHNPESQAFGPEIFYRAARCLACGACVAACPQEAIVETNGEIVTDLGRCVRCGVCTQVCPAEAREIAGKERSVRELMVEIERDRLFYEESGGGVTISGGEPLMQPAFLLELLQHCKSAELHTVVDTSGFAPWKTLDSIRELVDLFLYDVKLMEAEKHRRYTAVSNELILSNLARLSASGARLILRIPVIPGINDDEDNLRRTGALAGGLAGVLRVDLLPYHAAAAGKYGHLKREYRLAGARSPAQAELEKMAEILKEYVPQVKIGG